MKRRITSQAVSRPRSAGPAGTLGVLGAVALAGLWPASAATGQLPDAAAILLQAENVRSPELDYAVDLGLLIKNPNTSWKERTASYSLIAHGKDYSIVLMREPQTMYPGLLLIARGAYWLLLPKSHLPFQLAPRNVLNGDISNSDLARGNLLAHYEPRPDGEEQIKDRDCWRLELTRKQGLGLYPRIRYWITKKHLRPWKFEYFGETGALVKIAHYEDYREESIGVRAMRIVVDNPLGQGERTIMTFSNLRKFDTSGLCFKRQELLALRDAAVAKWEADGVQADLEQILATFRAGSP